jgi:hypothetical protein
MCPLGPKYFNIQPEGAACCRVCQISSLIWIGGKQISRVNCDLWWDMGAPLYSRIKAIQHGMASHGISIT